MSATESAISIETVLLLVVLLALVLPLTACTPAPSAAAAPPGYQGVCAVHPMGKNEAGVAFFAYQCRPTESQGEAR